MEKIPDLITPPTAMALRLRWKNYVKQLNARCRKDTGLSLAEIIVEINVEASNNRKNRKRT